MSIAAMNWVWQLQLRPNVKFVLLALADAADDQGICWPSIPTLAQKSCMDERSVQRIIADLKKDRIISVERRFRKDGSPISNKYRLALQKTGGDKLSPHTTPPPPAPDHQPDDASHPGGGGSDVVQTTTEPSFEPPPQPSGSQCCGGETSLIFPKQLQAAEIEQAALQTASFNKELAQAVLDELAGRLNANTVRGSPLGYLRSLCARAKQGTFTPEIGIRVATARQRAAEIETQKTSAPAPSTGETITPGEAWDQIRQIMKTTPKG